MWNEIRALLGKELLTEWRQRYAISGILLYVISTVFICYLSFKNTIDPHTWNALFWIIILFASVNATAKSFLQESRGRMLYFYTLCSPAAFIMAKTLYNLVLMSVLSVISLGIYTLLMNNVIEDMPVFLLTLFLGTAGLSSLLSMMSAIASKAHHNFTIMAILSFPVMVPLLITIIRLSQNAIDGIDFSVSLKYFIVLLSLDLIVVLLAYILFPYLWKE